MKKYLDPVWCFMFFWCLMISLFWCLVLPFILGCILKLSVRQLLLILPVPTLLWQAGLTQTGGSSNYVLPEWSPEVFNILYFYSVGKDVEETILLYNYVLFTLFSFYIIYTSPKCWQRFFCEICFFTSQTPLSAPTSTECLFYRLGDTQWLNSVCVYCYFPG